MLNFVVKHEFNQDGCGYEFKRLKFGEKKMVSKSDVAKSIKYTPSDILKGKYTRDKLSDKEIGYYVTEIVKLLRQVDAKAQESRDNNKEYEPYLQITANICGWAFVVGYNEKTDDCKLVYRIASTIDRNTKYFVEYMIADGTENMNKDFYKLFEIMQRQDNEVLGAEEIELME